MAEHVILFAGPMGAGKTTAIRALSDIPVVSTEAANSDRAQADKATTTVALDYGEIALDGGDGDEDAKVRLYGVPGQRRFDFVWQVLQRRAEGLVLLVHNDAPDPIARLREFLDAFGGLCGRGGVVVGVTRTDVQPLPRLREYAEALAEAHPDHLVPVLPVDPRDRADMRMLLFTLVANLEARALGLPVGPHEAVPS